MPGVRWIARIDIATPDRPRQAARVIRTLRWARTRMFAFALLFHGRSQAPTSSNSFNHRAGRPPSNLDTPVKPIPAPRCRRSSTPLAPHFEYENFLHSGPCAPDSAHPALHREEPHRGDLPFHGNSSSGAPKPSTPIGFLSCTAPTPAPRPPSGWSLGRAKRRESNDADRASTSPARNRVPDVQSCAFQGQSPGRINQFHLVGNILWLWCI